LYLFNEEFILSFTGFDLFFGLSLASEALIYEYIKREI